LAGRKYEVLKGFLKIIVLDYYYGKDSETILESHELKEEKA